MLYNLIKINAKKKLLWMIFLSRESKGEFPIPPLITKATIDKFVGIVNWLQIFIYILTNQ